MSAVSNLSFCDRLSALFRNYSSLVRLTLHHNNSVCDRPHLSQCQSMNRGTINLGLQTELQQQHRQLQDINQLSCFLLAEVVLELLTIIPP